MIKLATISVGVVLAWLIVPVIYVTVFNRMEKTKWND